LDVEDSIIDVDVIGDVLDVEDTTDDVHVDVAVDNGKSGAVDCVCVLCDGTDDCVCIFGDVTVDVDFPPKKKPRRADVPLSTASSRSRGQ